MCAAQLGARCPGPLRKRSGKCRSWVENYCSLLEICEYAYDFVLEELIRGPSPANVLISSKEVKRPEEHAANVSPARP